MAGPIATKVQAFKELPLSGMSDDAARSIRNNLRYLSATTDQLASELARVGQAVPSLDGIQSAVTGLQADVDALEIQVAATDLVVEALEEDLAALESRVTAVVNLAGPGGTWDVADLTGFPNFAAIAINPAASSNTLTLPILAADEAFVLAIKLTNTGGSVNIDAGAATIVAAGSPVGIYVLPSSFTEGALTITEYGVTLAWDGVAWQIINTAILLA